MKITSQHSYYKPRHNFSWRLSIHTKFLANLPLHIITDGYLAVSTRFYFMATRRWGPHAFSR